ncbi:DUF6325 family protein [Leifsonia sp. NPDC056665]|uniref:DUF6325 family protein n=1 Tax=Leifsonia sp. NPDC056665 TaxID=3345901 RepID=UPI00369FA832
MTEHRFGPVDSHLLGAEGERPVIAALAAIDELLANGLLRLLDQVSVSKDPGGRLAVTELESRTSGSSPFGPRMLILHSLQNDADPGASRSASCAH